MFGKKGSEAPSEYNRLLIHVGYLRDLAERLGETDKDAVLAAASLLEELGEYLRKTGALK